MESKAPEIIIADQSDPHSTSKNQDSSTDNISPHSSVLGFFGNGIINVENALSLLQSQLEQCQRDLSKLNQIKSDALTDPVEFIANISNIHATPTAGHFNSCLPKLQRIIKIPPIDISALRNHVILNEHLFQNNHLSKKNNVYSVDSIAANFSTVIANYHGQANTGDENHHHIMNDSVKRIFSSSLPGSSIPTRTTNSPISFLSQSPSTMHQFTSSSPPIPHNYASSSSIKRIAVTKARKLPGYRLQKPSIKFARSWLEDEEDANQLSSQSINPHQQFQQPLSQSHNVGVKRKEVIPWNKTERRKLIELLFEIPDQEISQRRYEKIASIMKTRTPQQVSSKYSNLVKTFSKCGLPPPGASSTHSMEKYLTVLEANTERENSDNSDEENFGRRKSP